MSNRMYSDRAANIAYHRGCPYFCTYCNFCNTLRRIPCNKCKAFIPHTHHECLNQAPPKTKDGQFITIGLTGDINFMPDSDWLLMWNYLHIWKDRTFMLQSKNPACFLKWKDVIPENVIIATTIETNRNKEIWTPYDPHQIRIDYAYLSSAPAPYKRMEAMVSLACRKAVTIEPILDFDEGDLTYWMNRIMPERIWIGYDSKPEKHQLPEPRLTKTELLISRLEDDGHIVVRKLMRKAWWEHEVSRTGMPSA